MEADVLKMKALAEASGIEEKAEAMKKSGINNIEKYVNLRIKAKKTNQI